MSRSIYQASARTYTHNLKNLSAWLKKAEKDARARGIDPSVFTTARLAPDMLPLTRQVQIATDHAKGSCARLAGLSSPSFKDDEVSFDDLQKRIARTQEFIRGIKAAQYDGAESREIVLQIPIGKLSFSGADYLYGWALPNFWFHLTTAYDILRHNGVQLGKGDFLGRVPGVSASGQIAKMMGIKPAKKKARAKKKQK